MLKTIIKVQNDVGRIKKNVVRKVVEQLENNEGVITIEMLFLIIVIAGILVISAIALKASFATWMATFDNIIDTKIDAVR